MEGFETSSSDGVQTLLDDFLAVMRSDRMTMKAVPFESCRRADHSDVVSVAIAVFHREIKEIPATRKIGAM